MLSILCTSQVINSQHCSYSHSLYLLHTKFTICEFLAAFLSCSYCSYIAQLYTMQSYWYSDFFKVRIYIYYSIYTCVDLTIPSNEYGRIYFDKSNDLLETLWIPFTNVLRLRSNLTSNKNISTVAC